MSVHHRPRGLSIAEGCRLDAVLSRSIYYDVSSVPTDDAVLVATMIAICDEFEAYGYRRVGAEKRHRGIVVNSKKIRRLMRENDLQLKRCKRFVATTNGDHDGPIFPDLSAPQDPRRPEPGLGGGHHLHRDRHRLRLYGRHPRCLVTPGGRICDSATQLMQAWPLLH